MTDAPHRYNADLAGSIEERWQAFWKDNGSFHAVDPEGEFAGDGSPLPEKSFIMDMFPYPSGKGLHVGHPLGYIATDVLARYERMKGKNVLYTMGYDAFGLPAEQYAIETGTHPRTTTDENVANMSRQLFRLGLSHDLRRALRTTDADFVKWTQWIFLQLFESWYDPTAENVDGVTGRARPISELKGAIQDREVDPWAMAEKLGIELPQHWIERKPSPKHWIEGDSTPFDFLVQYTPEQMQELVDSFRLAYISDTPVNWCPGLGTVLANEEVTADGRSERGNYPVFKRRLRQWNMRITAYADRLVDDLDRVDWPESIKLMQRNWIGRSHGAQVRFRFADAPSALAGGEFEVFTTRADTLFGATFCALSPEHALMADPSALPDTWPDGTKDAWTGGAATPAEAVRAYQQRAASLTDEDRTDEDRPKTGVFTGLFAVNPMDGRKIPVFVADYVLIGYGTGAVMAVPAEDERDYAFASAYDLDIIRTVQVPDDFEEGRAYTGDGEKINSRSDELDLNGLGIDDAKQKALEYAIEKGFGRARTTYRLRDWLFSRQRYWGEPFPIVYAKDDPTTPIPLPMEHLPVPLPELDDFSPTALDPNDTDTEPQTPLSRNQDWVNVRLDLGDGEKDYIRETNTMPNWAGSSWYELRYTDPTNEDELTSRANEEYWMGPRSEGSVGGVDLYVGGVEHAVLHLLYARFWHKVLFDLGHLSSQEPFHRLFNQGYVQAYAYTDARGVYVPAEEVVEEADGTFTYNGERVSQEYGKMGKSLKNSVTPDDMYAQFGADTFRVYEMSMGPLDQSRPWETRAVVGAQRFLQRLWRLVIDEETGEVIAGDGEADAATLKALHTTIDAVTVEMDNMRFNTAISKMIELVNQLTKLMTAGTAVPRSVVEPLILMAAPLAPHIAEEMWHRLGHEESLVRAPYPSADEAYLGADEITAVVQVKGKVRHRLQVPADITAEDLEARVMAEDRVKELLEGQELRKVIVRAPKLVNLVI
ncbi:leucine--tRNA ligase [Helcobacillus massiliensis]|uniref:leucine--tRNA ligase n=1 Tax=Helcobacillus massiliensis TaxID=521392 RepID=UPI0025558EF4|nr:leucine--tRNA ligase [Helcobacillus massiliensis]MDK7742334.1 leucine--tRNA ligase [Helcobacillus massiliensis]WOO92030.1 leucine--tRNA ligase [Helcobacillus massiliensis]